MREVEAMPRIHANIMLGLSGGLTLTTTSYQVRKSSVKTRQKAKADARGRRPGAGRRVRRGQRDEEGRRGQEERLSVAVSPWGALRWFLYDGFILVFYS